MKIFDPIGLARQAAAQYQKCYGQDLVAVILYGSAAGREFNAESSDINLLIVLNKVSLGLMGQSIDIQKQWSRKRFATPLFMDPAYISGSLDSFPVEFVNMRSAYVMLAGTDILSALKIDPSWLRLQIERELKGKLLHLEQEWLDVKRHTRTVRQLVSVSLKDFSLVFKALLITYNYPIPTDRKALFAAVEKIGNLEASPLSRTYAALLTGRKEALLSIFTEYVEAIRILSNFIDTHPHKESLV